MRVRKILLSSVVFSGLVFAVGMAAAEGTTVLRPNSDWNVSQIAAKTLGGAPYCAMARRFSDSTVLTMARNAGDESSLAFDFHGTPLDPAQSYYVVLDPGFQQKRAFDVRPVSGKAMVIRLGEDFAFYDALSRSGNLELEVSGQTFRFEMRDIVKGQQDLNKCLVQLIEPAAGGDDAPATAAADTAYVGTAGISTGQTSEELMAAPEAEMPSPAREAEVQSLKDENARLRGALEKERKSFEDRYVGSSEDSSRAAELAERVELLQLENTELKSKLTALPAAAAAAAPAAAPVAATGPDEATKAELSALRLENQNLKGLLDEQKAAHMMLERRAAELEKTATAAAKPAPAADNSVELSQLKARVDELVAENTKLKDSLTVAQAEAAAAKEQVASAAKPGDGVVALTELRAVETQLQAVKADRDSLSKQIETLSANKDSKLVNASTGDWDLEQATRRYNEAEREIRRLGRQLEEQKMTCSREKKEIEYMLFDPEIATKEQISKLMELEEELTMTKADLSQLRAQTGAPDPRQTVAAAAVPPVTAAPIPARNPLTPEFEPKMGEVEMSQRAAELAEIQTGAGQGSTSSINNNVGVPRPPMVTYAQPEPARSYEAVEREIIASAPTQGIAYGQQPPVAQQPVAPAPVAAMSQSVAAVAEPSVHASPYRAATSNDIQMLLSKANIVPKDGVKPVESLSGPDFSAFSWDTGTLFGSAVQKPMGGLGQFQNHIAQYLDNTKSRCDGDYAAVPSTTQDTGSIRISTYEIACIGANGQGASAALVFYDMGDGFFTAIAHETGLETMDQAMDAADRLIQSAKGESLASR